jgi:uncharacterized protein YhfF
VWPRVDGLRTLELGAPGDLAERLTGLVLSGAKRATAGLLQWDYVGEGEALDEVGEEQMLVCDGRPVARLSIARVEVHRFAAVPWEFVEAEGEGFESLDDWQDGHRRFWEQQGVSVVADDLVVCVWFSLLRPLGSAGDGCSPP